MRGFSSYLPLWVTLLATLCQCYVAHPPLSSLSDTSSTSIIKANTKTLWQAPTTPTWIENLAIRSSTRTIIFSLITTPEIYQLDEEQNASLLFQFPNVTSALGIVEIARDVFAVVVGNFSTATASGTLGTYSLWKVELFDDDDETSEDRVVASKITDIPEASFLNGITLLHPIKEGKDKLATVLISDSTLGAVFKVNTNCGTYEQVFDGVSEMLPPKNASIPIGINGLAVHKGSLYWTNTEREAIFSIPIDPLTGFARPNATVRTVASKIGIAVDDFAFDGDDNLWTAGGNTVAMLPAAGDASKTGIKPVIVVGSESSLTVAGSTSVRFADASLLYVTTDGGMAAPVNGSVVEAGKIVAVDLASSF
ncbi:uncharacterized protein TRUGW13939_03756 [Talaromyces rugulosus]|uniref:SMP-30/Gluconolactonase/LRE-like region domain-containing protein n=1 Tax=Talaromyces rugulosus TaxID=121627 RepID=A0A7H8QRP5_TALRU|nr:uncharacterized protein TRUGW13939_03756 [Talaromyces rugulosus]QKX56650.1 hypothetical protein TRUGW13939_03756 [Talaromyces rugulosus]